MELASIESDPIDRLIGVDVRCQSRQATDSGFQAGEGFSQLASRFLERCVLNLGFLFHDFELCLNLSVRTE